MTKAAVEQKSVFTTRSIPRAAVLPLLGAMIGFQLYCFVTNDTWISKLLVLAIGLAVFTAQMGVVWWRSKQLESLLQTHSHQSERVKYGLLRMFPASVSFLVGAIATLVGSLAIVAGSRLFSLHFRFFVMEILPPLALVQGICLIPLWMSLRCSVRSKANELGCVQRKFGKPMALEWTLLPVIVVPAVVAALVLGVESERIVASSRTEWQVGSHQLAQDGTMLDFDTSEGDGYTHLTRFDSFEPGEPTGDSNAHAFGTVFSRTPSYQIIAAVFLAALLSSLVVAFRSSGELEAQFRLVEQRLDTLPEGDVHVEKKLSFLKEINSLTSALDDLEERIGAMRAREKAAIEKGREEREMKAHFFAGMSHDLRSPLNSVIGFADLLIKGLEGDLGSEQLQTILLIGEDAEKLMVFIADILDTSKLEAGKLELDRSWVDAVDIVTGCISEARRLIGTRPVELLSSMHPGLPSVYADKIRLKQALVSLIARTVNVINKGTVKVQTSIQERLGSGSPRLRIEIIDASQSIGPGQLEQFRLSLSSITQTTQGRGGGLGLGIALARDVVRLHGGDLEVGDANRQNAAFTIILPLDVPSTT